MARKSQTNGASETPDTTRAKTSTGSKSAHKSSKSSKRKRFDWTNIDFPGFDLKPVKPTKKPKHSENDKWELGGSTGADILQDDPYGTNLTAREVRVSPANAWESWSRYKRFTIANSSFDVGDTVFIRADPAQAGSSKAPIQGWVAKVLEIRAGDSDHVYIRVYWLYRPEDLPDGRQPYHGTDELIASNDMAVIDAKTVEGAAPVVRWIEGRDETFDPDKLYWRQTIDVTKSPPSLSELEKHCIDKEPHNADNLLIECESCNNWLHGPCLEKAAVLAECEAYGVPLPNDTLTNAPAKRGSRKKKSHGAFVAKLRKLGSGDGMQMRLTVTDQRNRPKETKSWDVPIKCLLCSALIEDIHDESEMDSEEAISKPKNNAPETPANRSTEEEEEASSIAANDISSHIKPAPPKLEDSFVAPVDSAADTPASGPGDIATPPSS